MYSAWAKYFHPFDKFYPEAKQVFLRDETFKFEGPGVLIIWGGGDIHPSLYGRPNYASNTYAKMSARDKIEVSLMEQAIELKIPVIGVCRGAQLGCAAAGGILIQDVNGHTQTHRIKTSDGKDVWTSSLHHQMMYPWLVEHQLLAWSSPALSNEYTGITEEEASKIPVIDGAYTEPEVVWFPEIKCLAIQGHPEFMEETTMYNRYIKEVCDKCISNS